jgi:hypothetical protein
MYLRLRRRVLVVLYYIATNLTEASFTCILVLYSNKFEVGNLLRELKEREGDKYFIILPHAPPHPPSHPSPPAVRVEEEQKEGLGTYMEGEN